MAFLFLDDNEAESLLAAAREGQAAKLELIENIEKNIIHISFFVSRV